MSIWCATNEDTAFTISEADLLAGASDVDGDALSVTSVSVDASFGAVTDNGDGSWEFTPAADYNGDDVPFDFTVSDGTDTANATATLDVAAVNDGPVASNVDLGATNEDTAFTISEADLLAGASDVDGDALSVTSVSVDASFGAVADNGDGSWEFTPAADYNGDDVPFDFTVSDGTDTASATATLDVAAVNDGPVASNVDLGATNEDMAFTISEADLLAGASDVDGDALSVTSVSVDASFGAVTDNGDGSWEFTPAADYNGDDVPFDFTVSDGTDTASATATLDVAAVNDGPVASNVDLGATNEDTAFTINEADLLAGASDVDGDALSVTSVSVDASFGAVTDNGDGSWEFTPAADYNGDDVPFDFTVSDGTDTANATATLDVAAVNDGPVASNVDLGATNEDTAFTISEADLLAGASDVDGDALSVTSVSVDASFGAVTDNGDGSWEFTPAADYNGDDVPFDFTVSDGTDTASATATLDVAAVNDGPVASNVDLGATNEDTAFTISEADLLAGASDVDGDALSVTSVSVDASFGAVTDNGDGSWEFTPAADYNGDDVPFDFTVSDGTDTASATATLDVAAVNDGPVANNVDLGATNEDTAFTISEADLLTGASDVDGDALSITSVSVDASFGAVTDNGDGSWEFTPAADYNGDDVPFDFTVSDGTDTASATATLDVLPVDEGQNITGSGRADVLNGGDGSDTITAKGGRDEVHGNGGDDTINAGSNADTVYGGDGDDVIQGQKRC